MTIVEEIILASQPTAVPEQIGQLPFAEGFWPWMRVARERLRKRAGEHLEHLLPEAVLAIEEALVKRWVQIAAPSFALEMSISRLHGELCGETPYDRYCDYLRKTFWDREGLRAFFAEYKTLADLVGTFLELWEEQTGEFLQRLGKDLPDLAGTFHAGEPLGKVARVRQNTGDFHQGGRSVYYLMFESGKELFYKPKNLAFADAFHALLTQLNELGSPLWFKGYTLLPRGAYGWEEKVYHLPCKNLEEVTRYFERAGGLLCLLYLLDGTDIHHENLIASGEYPILIDQETFFRSTLAHPDQQKSADEFIHSVLKTALLPNFLENEGSRGSDIGGLTGEGAFFSAWQWKNMRTDTMKKSKESMFEERLQHRAIFEGVPQNAHEHVEEIVLGFRKMYAFIQKNRNFLVKKEGWIDHLAKFPVRMLIRGTRCYAYLLERLSCPSITLHEEEQKKELEILSAMQVDPDLEHLAPLVEEEKRAILQGDIPFFYSLPTMKHLYAGRDFVLQNCLEDSAHARAVKRIEEMNNEEREKQECFIRKSFEAKHAGFHETVAHLEKSEMPMHMCPIEEGAILVKVRTIADRLIEHAYRSQDGSLGWISLEPNPQFGKFELQPISDNLYGGRIGIALFFSAIYALTKEEKWKREALDTLTTLRTRIEKGNSRQIIRAYGIGGMSGAGSIIYGLTKIASLLQEFALLDEASILAAHIEDKDLEDDKMYDIIAGSAGLILALLALGEIRQEKRIMDLAIRAGEHLCAKAQELGVGGVGWKGHDGLFLLGFSHGVAGISFALIKLAAAAEKPEFSAVAQRALVYERTLFCPTRKNWPRLVSQGEPSFSAHWCHGAVGIGLGRLASLPYLHDAYLQEEIAIASARAKEELFSHQKLGLCCGVCGKLEFLRSAISLFPHLAQDLAPVVASLITHDKSQTKERFDLSFMQGAAGVGYTLLRTLDQENLLPQVLLMQ